MDNKNITQGPLQSLMQEVGILRMRLDAPREAGSGSGGDGGWSKPITEYKSDLTNDRTGFRD